MCHIPEKSINIIIIDDEKEACRNLGHLLQTYTDTAICIKGFACNTVEAEKLIRLHTPDAIFIDIEMPGENAFAFLQRLQPVDFEIIFVTAYDEYAVKAFKLNAIDYLLKPIDITELTNAVQKLKEKQQLKKLAAAGFPATPVPDKPRSNQITLRNHHQIEIVDFRQVMYIEANGNYSRIYFLRDHIERSIIMSHSIAEYEELLPATLFYRIHKSYLVNCMYIQKIQRAAIPTVTIAGKYKLPVGRRRYPGLLSYLKTNNFSDV
ncbi:LytR/AlgR family response regulator transcription factor [Chitinophaga nivalis]|uniref:LytTR family DNA-binding domain-containing protein n=1 Tax=Chitinophaga nivalis TaxID=2991709 RepID=A0ABT3ILC5_9BACT|nr:LytTR family DNA-binding domain-containing protein [Chitinophaga nivalis]MCW3465542.1 LytTR family DNA-binding domain-containing protein [Chitinophaga nivalis]MCW3484767.1 LytTR family DNA-binding domain-containing protein [Chitinophaga nivalis]